MYLSILSVNQKRLFLNLVYNIANVDDDYSKEEEKLIHSYCDEAKEDLPQIINKDSVEIISELANCSNGQERKIILFEVIGLVLCDKKYCDSEKAIIEQIRNAFSIENGYVDRCIKIVEKYFQFQNDINELVLG